MVSSGKATYHELDSVIGIEGLYDLLEIITIDAHNARKVQAAQAKGK